MNTLGIWLLKMGGQIVKSIEGLVLPDRSSLIQKHLLSSRDLGIKTRLRISKCYIWSTLLYGAETWTLSSRSRHRLEAFEMWLLRRILRISWFEMKTNEDVLTLAGERSSLIKESHLLWTHPQI